MSTSLSAETIEQMLQGLTPQPWGHVQLHTGEPPRDPSWACARTVRFEQAWTAETGGVAIELIPDASVPPGVIEVWSGSRLLGRVPAAAFGDPGEPGDILGRIDAALEDWERGEDAMRWRTEP